MHKTLDDLGGKLDGIQAAADSIQGDTAEILSNSSSLSIAAHISEIGGWPTSALAIAAGDHNPVSAGSERKRRHGNGIIDRTGCEGGIFNCSKRIQQSA